VKTSEVIRAWGKILKGGYPSLSIEITRECPLRCPGCYAYEPEHLGGGVTLRELNDRKGDALVNGILEVVDRYKPLHLSLVGGDPLVRYRELIALMPLLHQRGIHVQVVTSAFRVLPPEWIGIDKLNIVVSIDGLQPEHDERRKPATYDRILKNIAGHGITIHSTVTGQMMKRPGYLDEFLQFWTPRPEIRKIWFSLFTPQVGDQLPEMLTAEERARVIMELFDFRKRYPKLDMADGLIRQFALRGHSLPVRRYAGLLVVRVHRVNGTRGGRGSQIGGSDFRGCDLPRVTQDRPDADPAGAGARTDERAARVALTHSAMISARPAMLSQPNQSPKRV
jgi:sulfatase maturation enzyme AslB (radical SAM superfamily)